MGNLYTPNGTRIVATAELIPGSAGIISGSVRRDGSTFDFDYEGGTEVDWNGQHQQEDHEGRRLFYDEEGDLWSEDTLVFKND